MEEANSYDLENDQAKKAISYRSNKNSKNSYIQSQSNNNIPTRRHIPDKSLEALYNIPPIEDVLHDTEGSGDYEWVEQSFKVSDDIEWRKYLKSFKDNKVSDHRLGQLNDNDWKALIPTIGPRDEFKALWMQWQRQRAQSMHL